MGKEVNNELMAKVMSLIGEEGIKAFTFGRLSELSEYTIDYLSSVFGDEQKMLNDIFLATKQRFVDTVLVGYNDQIPFKSGLERAWNNGVNYYIEHFNEALFISQFMVSRFFDKKMRRASELQNQPVYKMISRGQRLDLIKALDPPLILAYVNGGVREVVGKLKNGTLDVNSPWRENAFILSWDAVRT